MRKPDVWTLGTQFAIDNDIHLQAMYTTRAYHKYDVHWSKYMKVKGLKDKLHINETFLFRVKRFKEALLEEAHDLYFELQDRMRIADVSRYLVDHSKYKNMHSWEAYLSQRLFETPHDKVTILDTRINCMMLTFVRCGRKLKRDTNEQRPDVEKHL